MYFFLLKSELFSQVNSIVPFDFISKTSRIYFPVDSLELFFDFGYLSEDILVV